MAQAKRIKVVHLISTLQIGGAERQVVELVTRLNRQVFDPKLYCLSGGGPLEAYLRQFPVDVAVFRANALGAASRLARGVRKFRALRRYLQQEQPDIVHCYMFSPSIYGGFASQGRHRPGLITNRRFLGLFKDGRPHYQVIENWVNRFTDQVVVNAEALKQDVLRRERIAAERVQVIYNGVDLHKFQPVAANAAGRAALKIRWGIPATAPVIGIVANLRPCKGHQDFLRAAARLHPQYPAARFVCIGQDRGIQPELERFCRQTGLQEHVVFTGQIEDVADVLPLLDVQVSASYEEGVSNAILEGMACAKPVVATAVGGTPEAVVHEETGVLIPPHAPDALAQAIAALLHNPQRARHLGANGRRRVERQFSMERMVQQFEDLYLTLNQNRYANFTIFHRIARISRH